MAKKRSYGGLIVGVLLLAGAATGAYFYWQKSAVQLPEVATTTVAKGDVVQVVTSTGDLQPVLTTDVSSQISGQIKEVRVDYNSPVKQGDILAVLDPATYDSKLKQAKAQLANTRANHTLVKLNYERSKTLFERNLVSQQELDQAAAQFEQASAQLLIQQAAVDNAETDLSRCTLYAPIDGIVIDRLAEVGKTVAASLNAPTLFTLVNDLTKMQIKAAVAEADIGNVSVGQDVNFTVDAYPNRQFRGRVAQIRNMPTTAQNVVTYATIIEVRNDDLKLKPGMTASVSIVIARRTGGLKIANSALRARIPEDFLPPKPVAAAPAGAEKAGPPAEGAAPARPPGGQGGNNREGFRQLMTDAGIDMRSGPPTAEQIAKLEALAKERGIEIPERMRAMMAGGGGGRDRSAAPGAVTTRTLYKLVGGTPAKPVLEAASVKLGITDGSATEVIEGIAEGDVIVTSISVPGAPAATTTRNPFSGGGAGPGGGAGGGRRF